MTWPTATKNNFLNGQPVDTVSLHDAFPGVIGSNEISGSPYARQAITLNAASGGMRISNAAVNVPVPACTVRWHGYWYGSIFVKAVPNGGRTPKNFVALPTDDTFYCLSHGYANDTKIVIYQGTPPPPLVEGTIYYVRDATTHTFRVAATLGGPFINLTGTHSTGPLVAEIVEDVYAGSGTHTISSSQWSIPD